MASRSDDEHLRVSPPTSSGSDASWVVYNPSKSSEAPAIPAPAQSQQPPAPAQQPQFNPSPRADPTPFSAAPAPDTVSPPSRSVYIPLDQSVTASTAAWPFQADPQSGRPYSTPESSSTAPFGIPWQSPALGSQGVAQSYAPGSSRIPSGGSIIDKKASPHPDGTPNLGTPTMHYPRPFYRPQADAAPPSLSQSIGSWSRARRKLDQPNPWDTPGAWLVYYFAFNLGLTLFNKGVLQARAGPSAVDAG